jgi:hypothetical protein
MGMVILFAALGVGALVLCVVGQVQTWREETRRLAKEQEELNEKLAELNNRTEYR